ncbi:MAG: cell division protein ZapA [Clostridiales Family XIII bacterium]|jgi:cell division protein ZapA|nr:cell division protein ZapA [Clostridiales Family XIII bacterium]
MNDLIKETKEYTVRIFGTNYIVRTTNDEEFVNKVASILDNKMLEIARKAGNIGQIKLTVLASLNIIEENLKTKIDESKVFSNNETLQEELKHYKELYDEAKEQFLSFQNENETLKNQVRNLETDLENLNSKVSSDEVVEKQLKEKEEKITELKEKVDKLESNLTENQEKYKDLENSFFEIQSENIKLKNNF